MARKDKWTLELLRKTRNLGHQKNARVRLGEGEPSIAMGDDGDFRLVSTQLGVKLYAKYNGKWYGFVPESDTTDNIITLDDTNSITDVGSITLAGGLIIKWGGIAAGATSGTETFQSEFPNKCAVVTLVPRENNDTVRDVKIKTRSRTQFTWAVSHASVAVEYIAIGN